MVKKTVTEVMLSLEEYATIGADCTIAEAVVALNKAQLGLTYDRHHHRAVLVFGEQGEVIGKLTHASILRSLAGVALAESDEVSLARAGLGDQFIESLRQRMREVGGSLEAICHSAAHVTARDAMVSAGASIEESASLEEAIGRMVTERCQSLLVRRGPTVSGILRLSDVFEEVADLIRSAGCEHSTG